MAGISIEQARIAKEGIANRLSESANVVGIGLTRVGDDYAVKVNLREEPSAENPIPTEVDGVTIVCEVVGPLGKRPA